MAEESLMVRVALTESGKVALTYGNALLRICSIQPSCSGFVKGFSQQQARGFLQEYCGHDGVPGAPDGTDLNIRRPKRPRNQPQTFNPEKDGANDDARRQAGHKRRCHDWLNDITTCHT